MNTNLYDQNNYYSSDKKASRLTSLFNPLLFLLDYFKARSVFKYYPKKKYLYNAIDIGAGDGKYLYFMSKRGWKVYGTTLSKKSQMAAKSQFNIDLVLSDTFCNPLDKVQYDVISYWHVFEHLNKPEAHIKKWKLLLKENGLIILEVPNIDSLGAKICYNSWLGSDEKHHCNMLTKKEISNILKKYNFFIKKTQYFSLKFSYVYLWSALLGKFFGSWYDFDCILSILKSPYKMLKSSFLKTNNVLWSIFYLSPLIIFLILLGLIQKKGEVLRLYIYKQ